MVELQPWNEFVNSLNTVSKASRFEVVWELILGCCYPPAAPMFAHCCRKRKALNMKKTVHMFSTGLSGKPKIWSQSYMEAEEGRVHARPTTSCEGQKMVMALGYDFGATLGYLDFFNFSKDPMDYAPGDLRSEIRLLVARGFGTFNEPFAIDVWDPLVQDLGVQGYDGKDVSNVISSFNGTARLMQADNLDASARERFMARLNRVVGESRLAGVVSVHTVVRQVVDRGPLQSTSFGSVCSSHATRSARELHSDVGLGEPLNGVAVGSAGERKGGLGFDADTFNGEVVGSSDVRGTWASSSSVVHRSRTDFGKSHKRLRSEIRLCIAFCATEGQRPSHPEADMEALTTLESRGPSTLESQNQPQRRCVPLTSPIRREDLAANTVPADMEIPGRSMGGRDAYANRAPRLQRQISRLLRIFTRFAVQVHRVTTPSTVLIALVGLFFAHVTCSILTMNVLIKMNMWLFVFWLLFPPLTMPLNVIFGLIFLFTDVPRVGRVFAALALFGGVNDVLVTVASLFHHETRAAWQFNFGLLLIQCVLRFGLFIVGHIQVYYVESARDHIANSSITDLPHSLITTSIPSSSSITTSIPSNSRGSSFLDREDEFATDAHSPRRRIDSVDIDDGFDTSLSMGHNYQQEPAGTPF